MKILITGNMGYVGPAVVRRIRQSYPGATIIGLDRGYFANCLTNAGIFPECNVTMQYFLDVRDLSALLLEGVDAIVHLAAISNDPIGNAFEDVTLDINYRGTVSLAEKARDAGVKSFVFASSCSMYGAGGDGMRTETAELNPLTAYARSKVFSERDLSGLARGTFTVTSLRFSTACGMSSRLRLDLVLNDFVAGAVASGRITILSDGTPWRPLIHISDMARAVDWAIQRQGADGGDFLAVNVGSDGWNYQVRDLAEAVAREIPGVDVSINKNAQPDKRSYRVDFGLFRELAPAYQPQVGLAEAIRDLKAGLEAMDFKDGDFRNSHLIRLKVLTSMRTLGLITDRLEFAEIPGLQAFAA